MPTRRTDDPSDRISTVERDVNEIRSQFGRVDQQLRHQDNELGEIRKSLQFISSKLEARSTTDWKALAAWAGLIITVVMMYTNLLTTPVRETIAQNRSDLIDLGSRVGLSERMYLEDLRTQARDNTQRGQYRERVDQNSERLRRLESLNDKQAGD